MRERYIKLGVWVLTFLLITFVLFPFYWMFTTSLKENSEIFAYTPTIIPRSFTIQHYVTAWVYGKIGSYFKNSLIVASLAVVLSFLVVVPAAFSASLYRTRGTHVISTLVLALQMFPGILLLIPLYVLMKRYQLIDTYAALVVSYTTFTVPFCLLLVKTYFDNLPHELYEAARIDGCSDFLILWKIAIPLIIPGIMVVTLFSFVLAWCDFMFAKTLTNTETTRTITVGLSTLQGSWTVEWGPLMAAASIATIPVLVIFSLANRYIIEGLTAGAIKG